MFEVVVFDECVEDVEEASDDDPLRTPAWEELPEDVVVVSFGHEGLEWGLRNVRRVRREWDVGHSG